MAKNKLMGGPVEESKNLEKKQVASKDMNFKVPSDFHFEFKLAAMKEGIQMKEFLYRIFEHWKETNQKD